MKIIIDLDTREVTVESAELVLARDKDRSKAFNGITSMLSQALASRAEPSTGSVGTEAAPEGTTEKASPTASDVLDALQALKEEKPQWGARSEAAISKRLGEAGFDVSGDFVAEAIESAVNEDLITGRARRDGEIVYTAD